MDTIAGKACSATSPFFFVLARVAYPLSTSIRTLNATSGVSVHSHAGSVFIATSDTPAGGIVSTVIV